MKAPRHAVLRKKGNQFMSGHVPEKATGVCVIVMYAKIPER